MSAPVAYCEFVADSKRRGWQRCKNCGQRVPVPWPQRLVATCRRGGDGSMQAPPPGGCCDPPPTDADGRVLPE